MWDIDSGHPPMWCLYTCKCFLNCLLCSIVTGSSLKAHWMLASRHFMCRHMTLEKNILSTFGEYSNQSWKSYHFEQKLLASRWRVVQHTIDTGNSHWGEHHSHSELKWMQWSKRCWHRKSSLLPNALGLAQLYLSGRKTVDSVSVSTTEG